jgi:hypothetical protein
MARRLYSTPNIANILFAINWLSSLSLAAEISLDNPNGRLGFLVGGPSDCTVLTLGGKHYLHLLDTWYPCRGSCTEYQMNLKESIKMAKQPRMIDRR